MSVERDTPSSCDNSPRVLKRHHGSRPVLKRIGGTMEDRTSEFLCPVCFDTIQEAHITRCGHTFCFQCIMQSIETMGRCPKCSLSITSRDHVFPNFLLNELISKQKMMLRNAESGNPGADGLRDYVTTESHNLSLPDVNVILEVLTQRKHLLEAESCAAQNRLLHEFLKQLLVVKEEQKMQLAKEMSLIRRDMEEVENILQDVQDKCPTLEEVDKVVGSVHGATVVAMRQELNNLIDTTIKSSRFQKLDSTSKPEFDMDGFNSSTQQDIATSLAARRKRMYAHFDDFVQCYFSSRAKDLYFSKDKREEKPPKASSSESGISSCSGLDTFRENLVKFSRYNALRPLATLNYSSDIFTNSTIVSSIEFDKDNEFFAIAGVTKRIKVFDYGAVIKDTVDIHYPCVEMQSSSKISCISWNSYHKGILALSEYEGTVTVWDVTTGHRTKTFQEHDKRCWSVDFNNVDTRLIASGSDDGRVKLWSLNVDHSIATLEAKANVCCVKFNPRSSCHLAFGSADHCVHYYDLRNMKEALAVFKGHRKAVSYVKFLNMEEIVSASTDSQLKMWNINSPHCLRTFVGHVNEKNFVGLATDGDYVACGSENNSLYVYYKGLTKQLFSFKFDAVRSVLSHERKDDEPNEFVSAVCWRQLSNVVVAANSQGIIKILELVNGPIKAGKSRLFWGLNGFPAVVVAGLGHSHANEPLEDLNVLRENTRIAAGVGCMSLLATGITEIIVDGMENPEAAAEGAILSSFAFQKNKSASKRKPDAHISLYGSEEQLAASQWQQGIITATAQNWARTLMETPANQMTPTIFASEVESILTPLGVKVDARDKSWAEQNKMGSFLSVSQGSAEPPVFLELTYNGKGDDSNPMVLVGKGVTFDTGGISLKPSSSMDDMRADMGGAACVVSTIRALAELQVKVNVKGLVPLCENMPGGKATKPGDVVTAMNGQTICVDNTDAEGRLILADALCYSEKLKPAWVVDIATLTGAMRVALGGCASGAFATDEILWNKLHCAGYNTGDRVWRFPLFKHYLRRMTDYSGYDINNLGQGKGGGSCTAAAFLSEFRPKNVPWIHIDIASVMNECTDQPYMRKGMTGRPTRTLIEFIRSQSEECNE